MSAEALRVLLVDDEPLARARLRSLLAACTDPAAQVVGEAAHAGQLADLLTQAQADCVLLDVQMPGQTGVQAAQRLRTLGVQVPVVFVTAHAEHALAAFEVDAADYLTKPVRQDRLQAALQKVLRTRRGAQAGGLDGPLAQTDLVIHERGRMLRLALSEVLVLKAELKYVTVHTVTNTHLLDVSLSELETGHAAMFLRINRNLLVARRAIRAIERHAYEEEGEGWMLKVEGLDEWWPVSRRQVPTVRAAFQALAGGGGRPGDAA